MAIQLKRVLWAVDIQRDFMLPGGALYVSGAEKLLRNINRLVDLARKGEAFLISSGCQHTPDDPEFKTFPPHCVRGTPGAELIPEASTGNILRVPNDNSFLYPKNLFSYQQLLLEKQVLDVFTNPNAAKIVNELPPDAEFFVFGVVTEYCVQFAAKGLLDRGRPVAVVGDAIETLAKNQGEKTVRELCAKGARLVCADEAVGQITRGT